PSLARPVPQPDAARPLRSSRRPRGASVMPLQATDIDKVRFPTADHGYSQAAVDEFLGTVKISLATAEAALARAREPTGAGAGATAEATATRSRSRRGSWTSPKLPRMSTRPQHTPQ